MLFIAKYNDLIERKLQNRKFSLASGVQTSMDVSTCGPYTPCLFLKHSIWAEIRLMGSHNACRFSCIWVHKGPVNSIPKQSNCCIILQQDLWNYSTPPVVAEFLNSPFLKQYFNFQGPLWYLLLIWTIHTWVRTPRARSKAFVYFNAWFAMRLLHSIATYIKYAPQYTSHEPF